ncbi:MAG: tetratricopeptide repeat protein [Xanthomonadales bacterium]|nr:tetratricopeptide repeat protein [Xanthomonadales bacterium]
MSDLRAQLQQAGQLAQAGRLGEAAEICESIVATDPEMAEAYLILGLGSAQAGDPDKAVRYLGDYVERRPADPNGWYNLGVVHQQGRRWEAAAEAFRQALDRAPRMIPAAINLAAMEQARGRPEAALEVLARQPAENAQVARALARHWSGQGQATRAVEALEKALESHPREPGLHDGLLEALIFAGELDRARTVLARARELLGNSPRLDLRQGQLLLAGGELRTAVEILEGVLEQAPGDPEAWSLAAAARSRVGRQADAIAAAREACRLAPSIPRYHFNLAALLSKRTDKADLQAGLAAAEACLALNPGHAPAAHCRGLIQAKLDDPDVATESLRQAVALAPENPTFGVDLGDHLTRLGALEHAAEVYREAAARSPEDPRPPRQLGINLIKSGSHEDALESLDEALRHAPVDQRAIAHRAVALQHLGRHDEAERYLGFKSHIRRTQVVPPRGFADIGTLNAALAEDIASHSLLRWEPVGLAARNGALTEELLADETPAIMGFGRRLREIIEQLRTTCQADPQDPFLQAIPGPDYELNVWATLVHGGGNIDTHIHEESWLSGAYYVELPSDLGRDEADPAGWIEFGRPHTDVPFAPDSYLELIRPEPGLLLLFPSYLFHRTIPHRSEDRRISISFDLVPT